MTLDEGLIQEVQIKATGATIHKVISKITVYKCCIDALKDIKEVEYRKRILDLAQKVEKSLRIFIVTGRLE